MKINVIQAFFFEGDYQYYFEVKFRGVDSFIIRRSQEDLRELKDRLEWLDASLTAEFPREIPLWTWVCLVASGRPVCSEKNRQLIQQWFNHILKVRPDQDPYFQIPLSVSPLILHHLLDISSRFQRPPVPSLVSATWRRANLRLRIATNPGPDFVPLSLLRVFKVEDNTPEIWGDLSLEPWRPQGSPPTTVVVELRGHPCQIRLCVVNRLGLVSRLSRPYKIGETEKPQQWRTSNNWQRPHVDDLIHQYQYLTEVDPESEEDKENQTPLEHLFLLEEDPV